MRNLLPVLCMCASAAPGLLGHEITTHKRLGDAAVVYLYSSYSILDNSPLSRPLLLNSITALQENLQYGEEHEDDDFGVRGYGRFLFHFPPALLNTIQL